MAGQVVIVGGTSGLGRQLAQVLSDRGEEVVISGRDATRAAKVAAEIGGKTTSVALDLAAPEELAQRLSGIRQVKYLVLAAIERDQNTVKDYNIAGAIRLVTLKLVGYTEVIHALTPRLVKDASIVLFGGLAKERPYPGSTTVTTVNGGITSMVRTLAVELAPVRVNAVHPGVVGDTDAWSGKPDEVLERIRVRTPTGRLVTTDDVVHSVLFLLENGSVNGVNLNIDGGWLLL
jgi:NAD(P)-dependent dehydrogenase (short-subunit alcohol dehydrogenase family)